MTKQNNALRLAEQYDYGDPVAHSNTWKAAVCTELRRQHARIAELEAQLSSSGFTAADMATASAQGFRDGVASVAASAGSEPVAWKHDCAALLANDVELWIDACPHCGRPRMHATQAALPSPPEGMVGGWQDIATAPKDSGYLLLRGRREQDVASGYWLQSAYDGNGAWIWPHVHISPWFWAPLPPTTSAGSGEGE